ncbi:MAG: ParB/RepB/Spo0J family partition protein [Alphaproteobacteria bacterium]|nr:ParB/RepB/Spo0J family partition protein [Alphaproteobacteria bacterium]
MSDPEEVAVSDTESEDDVLTKGTPAGRRRRNLGRGLAALFGDEEEPGAETAAPGGETAELPAQVLPTAFLKPNPFQPRRAFDDEQMDALVASISEKGVLQPILVRPVAGEADAFEIIAGERRWRAAQRAQLHEVPVFIKALEDHEALEVALVENIQRQDLSAIEEAEGYQRLIDEFGHTQGGLAKVIGRSRSHIANTLRLLNLPATVRQLVDQGALTAGHARALLSVDDPEALAKKVVRQGLNVRQVERLVQKRKPDRTPTEPKAAPEEVPLAKDSNTRELEHRLSEKLGLAVDIRFDGKGGSLTVHYHSLEQLDDVVRRLGREPSDDTRF